MVIRSACFDCTSVDVLVIPSGRSGVITIVFRCGPALRLQLVGGFVFPDERNRP